MKRIVCIALLFCSWFVNTQAIDYNDVTLVPNPKTANNTFVSNPDGILSYETVETLNAQLNALERETSAEFAVVALNSIGSENLEDFANKLFNYWGIGKKDKDNGVLFLFVLDQRADRIEVGYGLEGVLPDAICKRIQTQVMIPEFKAGNYDAGILEGVKAAETFIREETYEFANAKKPFPIVETTIVVGIFIFWAWLALRPARRAVKEIKNNKKLKTNKERYETFVLSKNNNIVLGCFFSFFLPFLAFPFALLGLNPVPAVFLFFSFISVIPAVIYKICWEKRFRNQPVACPKCAKEMKLLPEADDHKLLNEKESLEDILKSVDADVFRCEDCNETVVFRYDNSSSKYKDCTSCGTKALFLQSSKTIIPATYLTSGTKKETYQCKFCNQTTTQTATIPRLTRSSSSGGSSSRSSGGSFGGGRSGGGGSSSRW